MVEAFANQLPGGNQYTDLPLMKLLKHLLTLCRIQVACDDVGFDVVFMSKNGLQGFAMFLAIRKQKADTCVFLLPPHFLSHIRCNQPVAFVITGQFGEHFTVFVDRIIVGPEGSFPHHDLDVQDVAIGYEAGLADFMMYIAQMPEDQL